MNEQFSNDLHVPKVKPFSNDTWEVQISLPGAVESSERTPLVFPEKCRIVGLYPSLSINGATGGGLLIPTLDDIMLFFDVNQKRRYTNQIGQTAQAQRGQGFVTLGSMDTRVRDINLVIDTPRPEAGFAVRWKRFTQGTPIYVDQIVSLALMVEIG